MLPDFLLSIQNQVEQYMRAAFFDVDGTLTTTRVWQGIMNYFKHQGSRRFTHLVFLAYHYPLYFIYRLGLISESGFRAPWAAHLGWYFRGYTVAEGERIWDWIVEEFIIQNWRADILEKLHTHRNEDDLVMLVSGGPLPLLRRIAVELGVDHAVGTKFEIKAGKYTGGTAGPVCLEENKASLSKAYLTDNDYQIDFQSSYAYADSISDRSLLEMVGNPIAVYPFNELREFAKRRGWQLFPK
jgi:HAD superfamily hydrolase (TIGR01490 family)